MNFWEKLQYAAIGLIDLSADLVETLIQRGTGVFQPRSAGQPGKEAAERQEPVAETGGKRWSKEQKRQHILACLADGKRMKLGDIAESAGKQAQLFRGVLNEMVDEGAIVKRKDRRYTVRAGRTRKTSGGAPARPRQPRMTRAQQQEHIVACLSEGKPLTMGEIASRVGRLATGFSHPSGVLVRQGKIVKREDGRYELASPPPAKKPARKKPAPKAKAKGTAPRGGKPKSRSSKPPAAPVEETPI